MFVLWQFKCVQCFYCGFLACSSSHQTQNIPLQTHRYLVHINKQLDNSKGSSNSSKRNSSSSSLLPTPAKHHAQREHCLKLTSR
jgi:hypothetical protein